MKFKVSLFILVMKMESDISKINLLQEIGILPTDLKFVATVATGGRVKFLSAV